MYGLVIFESLISSKALQLLVKSAKLFLSSGCHIINFKIANFPQLILKYTQYRSATFRSPIFGHIFSAVFSKIILVTKSGYSYNKINFNASTNSYIISFNSSSIPNRGIQLCDYNSKIKFRNSIIKNNFKWYCLQIDYYIYFKFLLVYLPNTRETLANFFLIIKKLGHIYLKCLKLT